ncbi:MAG: hypothetical protein D8M59_08240 [Planctomycetes bacterium]|nr:hypothetical protein [Planctomycetota bacterium]
MLAVSGVLGSSSVAAPPLKIGALSTATTKEKVFGSWSIDVTGEKKGRGQVETYYDFHDPLLGFSLFLKDPKGGTVKPDIIESNHTDIHGTNGTANYTMHLNTSTPGKQLFNGTVRGTLTPGKGPRGAKVSLSCWLEDPFTFSDSDPDAPYNFVAEGLDHSLTLNSGTSFPAVYTLVPDTYGSIPSETYMLYKARVAPGLVPDPDAFWASPANFVDLYTMTISADVDHTVTVVLEFGSSTADFVLDYRDKDGVPFDPNDPAQVDAVEDAIAANFVNGALPADLEDVFTVGFDPDDLLGETMGGFTYGSASEALMTAYETPEPGCLDLSIDNNFAGTPSTFTLCGLTPGGTGAVLYDFQEGAWAFSGNGWCVDFGLDISNPGQAMDQMVGQGVADGSGCVQFTVLIPCAAGGFTIYFQGTEKDTCPDSCMSNVLAVTFLPC